MKRILLSAVVAGSACLLAPAFGRAGGPISADEFRHIERLVKPCPGEETWARIPWLSSLWEARKQAAGRGKPILLWEMDGHPLGCT